MLHPQMGILGSVIPGLTIGQAEYELFWYIRETLGVDFRIYESKLTTGAPSASVASLCTHVCYAVAFLLCLIDAVV